VTAPDNLRLAETLDQIADLLAAQDGDAFRVRAYRAAAENVRGQPRSLAELDAEGGAAALAEIPGVGKSIAGLLAELLHTGRSALLTRLSGQVSPEDLFTTLPGIGEALARRLHDELQVETLEELELAAHDGRLERLPGFGRRRTQALRALLEARLSRSPRRRARLVPGAEARAPVPSVALLLSIDDDYRLRASRDELPKIAPRRFNPEGRAWLPVLHVTRDGWHFTALFSNTARAHELGTTRDWVILYYERDGHEGQCTVVTERRGPRAGQRVVRGREAE